ncbi:hypothetical protein [Vibrio tapetis]|uniref:Uncharacterized protein n=1 Tax=Vibrio tapetis subsp. tapetis TaxID=1671868 RepID=A0A2N8ZMM5_9VIBR|nr:hypothetical protein [Vibrio tapetis]SON53106.1 exported protein of unknown function [Vibrio tapetis subsp. tapetis]
MMNLNKYMLAAIAVGGCLISMQSMAADNLTTFKRVMLSKRLK